MSLPGDQVRVSAAVAVPPAEAFRAFTDDIDRWWRRGLAYRVQGPGRGILHLEPWVGGRLFEQFDGDTAGSPPHVVATGTVREWDPPHRLAFEWRGVNFAPGERTEVLVRFEPAGQGTRVVLEHRGFAALRPDHPVRHGQPVPAFIRGMGLWWGGLLQAFQARLRDPAAAGPPQDATPGDA
jgi:uncharacterized protein YndB with AHSA1/START domain